jgi:hypothetical protein
MFFKNITFSDQTFRYTTYLTVYPQILMLSGNKYKFLMKL